MPIKFIKKDNVFILNSKETSYIIFISKDKVLLHLYYGSKLKDYDIYSMSYRYANNDSHLCKNVEVYPDTFDSNGEASPFEFPCFGRNDYRLSAVKILNDNGDCVTDFRYKSHKIYKGKKKLEGLPCLYGNENEVTTLEIKLFDNVSTVEATLQYNVFENYNAITRSVSITNTSSKSVVVKRLYSACLELPTSDYEFYHLSGKYAKERTVCHNTLNKGIQSIHSLEGKSSHFHNPFVALASHESNEEYGHVYAANFVYSGNYDISIEVDGLNQTRLLIGINPETFEYRLNKNEKLQAPEVVMVYSDEGLGKMSRTFHHLYDNHLIRGKYKTEKRPLLINSWEGTYFDFDTDKIINYAIEAKKLGMEMVVLDDGWFSNRNNDLSSLGDWYVNKNKVDLHKVVNKINELGLKFGLWFEPEMICPDSNLYRKHPEYALAVKGRDLTLMRHQLVLDMSRKDVIDNIYNQIDMMLKEYNIEYIKWDFNRALADAGSFYLSKDNQGQLYHKFILGTYELLDRITTNYPDLLIETCCAGGGRYDAGMLYYGQQVWASDDTDPIERLTIQEGTSMCYPPSTMGSHVSACARTGYETKGNVALAGTFGYELNPMNLTEDDRKIIKKQVQEYHMYYDLIKKGDLYRLISPSSSRNFASWMFVSNDKKEALFTIVCLSRPDVENLFVKLKGLDDNIIYYCSQLNLELSGKYLKNFGLNMCFFMDTGDSRKYYFKEVRKH